MLSDLQDFFWSILLNFVSNAFNTIQSYTVIGNYNALTHYVEPSIHRLCVKPCQFVTRNKVYMYRNSSLLDDNKSWPGMVSDKASGLRVPCRVLRYYGKWAQEVMVTSKLEAKKSYWSKTATNPSAAHKLHIVQQADNIAVLSGKQSFSGSCNILKLAGHGGAHTY